jgi:DNA-binding HxlR family transcriptional regulator
VAESPHAASRPAYLSLPDRAACRRLEDVVGCKRSAAVLAAIGRGVTRPGQLVRFIRGISTKVPNDRLRQRLESALVTRRELPDRILRVDYALNDTGRRLAAIIEQICDFDEAHAQCPLAARNEPLAGRTRLTPPPAAARSSARLRGRA